LPTGPRLPLSISFDGTALGDPSSLFRRNRTAELYS